MAFDPRGLLPPGGLPGTNTSSSSGCFKSSSTGSSDTGAGGEGKETVVIQAKARGLVKLWKACNAADDEVEQASAAAHRLRGGRAYHHHHPLLSLLPSTYPRNRQERARVLTVLNHHPYFIALSAKEKEEALKLFFPIRVKKGMCVTRYVAAER